MQKRSWKKAEANRQVLCELASKGPNIYATLYRWIKSGKIDQKIFIRVMRYLEVNGVESIQLLKEERKKKEQS